MPNDPTHREDDSVAAAIEAAINRARDYAAAYANRSTSHAVGYAAFEAMKESFKAIAEAARREQTAARPAELEPITCCGHDGPHEYWIAPMAFGCDYHGCTPPTPEPARELNIPRESKTVAGPVVQSERTAPLFLEQAPEPAPRRMMGNEQHHDATHRSEHDEHDVLCQNWSTHPPCQPLPEPVDGV